MAVETGWVTVASVSDVRPGTVEVFEVDGRALCVGQTADGRWGAIDDLCTHDGGDLGEGELVGDAVECPRHGSVFDLFTGEALTLPAVYPVKAYRTRVAGQRVEVEL